MADNVPALESFRFRPGPISREITVARLEALRRGILRGRVAPNGHVSILTRQTPLGTTLEGRGGQGRRGASPLTPPFFPVITSIPAETEEGSPTPAIRIYPGSVNGLVPTLPDLEDVALDANPPPLIAIEEDTVFWVETELEDHEDFQRQDPTAWLLKWASDMPDPAADPEGKTIVRRQVASVKWKAPEGDVPGKIDAAYHLVNGNLNYLNCGYKEGRVDEWVSGNYFEVFQVVPEEE